MGIDMSSVWNICICFSDIIFARNPLVAQKSVGCFLRINKKQILFIQYQKILNASVIFKGTLHAVYLHYLNIFPTEFFFFCKCKVIGNPSSSDFFKGSFPGNIIKLQTPLLTRLKFYHLSLLCVSL